MGCTEEEITISSSTCAWPRKLVDTFYSEAIHAVNRNVSSKVSLLESSQVKLGSKNPTKRS